MTLILTNKDVEQVLDRASCIEALKDAFTDLGKGEANNVPRSDIIVQSDDPEVYYAFKSMSGAVKRLGVAAIRIDSDILHWPTVDGTSRRTKITASQGSRTRVGKENGLVLLYSIENAELLAILQDGHIQRARVGATSALATDKLARRDARIVGLLGSGYQAEEQIRALCMVRALKEVRVFSPNPENRRKFAGRMEGALGVSMREAKNPDTATEGADIIVASTNSMSAVIEPRWLRPGVHYNCIKKEEVDCRTLDRTDLMVVTTNKNTINYPIGSVSGEGMSELGGEGWWSERATAWEKLPTIPDLIVGRIAGRTSAGQVTGYIGHGNAIQFAAVGALVYREAKAQKVGKEIPTEWFLQEVYQR